jgi:hypothetical protein
MRPASLVTETARAAIYRQDAVDSDLLLRRSFHARGQPASFLIRAGLLVVWLQLNVSGFRPVLARMWHGQEAETPWPTVWMQTTGAVLLMTEPCSLARAQTTAQDGPSAGCCT